MKAIIVGLGSEIAHNIYDRLERDGWLMRGCRHDEPLPTSRWDLLLLAQGTMEPIGKFFDTEPDEWARALCINALTPLSDLRSLWPQRLDGAKVVFMGGPNLANASMTYSAYRFGKAGLESILPTLNAEYPGHRFLMLHPGVVRTKIHQQTLAAGSRAANLERAKRIVSGEEQTVSHDQVYAKLLELIA